MPEMGETLMIDFVWPYIFFLLPLPWFIYKFWPSGKINKIAALKVPAFADFDNFRHSSSPMSAKIRMIFLMVMWLALLTSAARPQWIGKPIELPRTGRDLMLAVDLSGSMQMQDFEINGKVVDRLNAIKLIAGDFIEKREGDRIGLILFGSHVYLQAPLTFDLVTVKQLLMESAVGLAGNETAIGDAIGLAVKQLRDSPHQSRVLVLMTDGVNNAGELTPEKAAEIAAHAKLKVHTVAIGSNEMVVQTLFGPRKMNASAGIDEQALQMVAAKTGGQYFRAYNTNELIKIYQHIDEIESIEHNAEYFRPTDEMYYWPLTLALMTLGLLMCYDWKFRC